MRQEPAIQSAYHEVTKRHSTAFARSVVNHCVVATIAVDPRPAAGAAPPKKIRVPLRNLRLKTPEHCQNKLMH